MEGRTIVTEECLEWLALPEGRVLRRELLDAVDQEKTCACIGCSHQSVPSLSKTAMRSAGRT